MGAPTFFCFMFIFVKLIATVTYRLYVIYMYVGEDNDSSL